MKTLLIIGILTIFLGIGMFCLGGSMFAYQGPPLNPIIYEAGKYSFIFWIPTIIVGIVLIVISLSRDKKP